MREGHNYSLGRAEKRGRGSASSERGRELIFLVVGRGISSYISDQSITEGAFLKETILELGFFPHIFHAFLRHHVFLLVNF